MAKYLQLDFGKGKFFQNSKEQTDGSVEHKTSTGKVYYRTYIDEPIKGSLVSLSVEKNENLKGAEELKLSLKEENGDYINITVMLLSPNGNYTAYVESLIKHLPNMKKGEVYTIQPFNFKNEKDRSIIGLSIKDINGQKVDKLNQIFISKEGVKSEGDIPAVVWEVKRGKNTPNYDDQQDYLFNVLEQAKEALKPAPRQENTTITVPPVEERRMVENAVTPVVSDEEDDDLPF